MKTYIAGLIDAVLSQFELDSKPDYVIEQPKVAEHGDLSTNVAMMLSKPLRKNPRQIAQELVERFEYNPTYIEKIEIAGPGFINFKLTNTWVQDQLGEIINKGVEFGKTDVHAGKTVLVEFVSANPTGPLTVGHGRNAVLGDTISRLYEWNGAKVTREYYFNNAGRQMRVLGESVKARYLQLLGEAVELPEGSYEGEYIKDISAELIRLILNNYNKIQGIKPEQRSFNDPQLFEFVRATVSLFPNNKEHDVY
jgi:arginyl-tRNA synthetase